MRRTVQGLPHLTIEQLQWVMVDAWPPLERARLGGWLMRASRGFTHRGNSVVTAGDPGVELTEALPAVEAWYAARGLPADLTVAGPLGFDPWSSPLGSLLSERGYAARVPTLTLVATAAEVLSRTGSPRTPPGLNLSPTLEPSWLAAYGRYRAVDEVSARGILTGSPAQVFGSVTQAGATVAVGRLALASGWGGIAAMWVDPAHRGQGLARALLAAFATSARQRGVAALHLQTDTTNTAALALYERAGFHRHHAYVNVRREAAAPAD